MVELLLETRHLLCIPDVELIGPFKCSFCHSCADILCGLHMQCVECWCVSACAVCMDVCDICVYALCCMCLLVCLFIHLFFIGLFVHL